MIYADILVIEKKQWPSIITKWQTSLTMGSLLVPIIHNNKEGSNNDNKWQQTHIIFIWDILFTFIQISLPDLPQRLPATPDYSLSPSFNFMFKNRMKVMLPNLDLRGWLRQVVSLHFLHNSRIVTWSTSHVPTHSSTSWNAKHGSMPPTARATEKPDQSNFPLGSGHPAVLSWGVLIAMSWSWKALFDRWS